jgi:hypothetical protein
MTLLSPVVRGLGEFLNVRATSASSVIGGGTAMSLHDLTSLSRDPTDLKEVKEEDSRSLSGLPCRMLDRIYSTTIVLKIGLHCLDCTIFGAGTVKGV